MSDNTYINKKLEECQKDREKANAKLEAAEQKFKEEQAAVTKELAEIAEAEARLLREGKGINAMFPDAGNGAEDDNSDKSAIGKIRRGR